MKQIMRHLALLCLFFGATSFAQISQPASLRFEVATIKPTHSTEPGGIRVSKGRLQTQNTSIVDLLKYSYGVHVSQVLGVPGILVRKGFDIEGVVGGDGPPNSEVYRQMVRTLLAERFGLICHTGQKELSVYTLTVASPPISLTPTAQSFPVPSIQYAPGALHAGNATMHDFAAFLQRYVTDRPVIDQTSIQGKYDMDLRWTPDESPSTDVAKAQEFPNLFTAIREQLGLKLQGTKMLTDVIVIDSLTAPTAD